MMVPIRKLGIIHKKRLQPETIEEYNEGQFLDFANAVLISVLVDIRTGQEPRRLAVHCRDVDPHAVLLSLDNDDE
jgi:hypothetical protein